MDEDNVIKYGIDGGLVMRKSGLVILLEKLGIVADAPEWYVRADAEMRKTEKRIPIGYTLLAAVLVIGLAIAAFVLAFRMVT